ncbi:MAG TPA: metal-dependent transcriptional regulator [Actinomycetota bacterium]|nr:metal-dependent transcriptional regulator [Actinomycetota bacterium]
MTAPQALTASDYLEALYEMIEEDIPAQQARLAEWMGVSRASVSEAVKRLVRDGLLTSEDRTLAFTRRGLSASESLVRRHRLAERFLIEVIGLRWHLAHEEATRWGHVVSDQVEERLVEILGDPATCPHGNPIPGSSHPVDHSDLRPLNDFGPGARVRLERLTEDLELELEVMRFFEESGLMPGADIAVESVAPDGTMTLSVAGHGSALGAHLADNLWVRPAISS